MKGFLVRLCLWVLLLTGLFFSARHVLDSQRAGKASRDAARIAGLTEKTIDSAFMDREHDLREGKEKSIELTGETAEKTVEEIAEKTTEETAEKTTKGVNKAAGDGVSQAEPLPEDAAFLAEIHLNALQEVNKDVLGWIAIPGTKLSYPIVQGEDNDEYLNRNWKKEKSISGSIFLESTNSSNFTDFHTILYGHRMRDRTMFGVLKDYQRLDFLQEHPNIYIVLENAVYRYTVFAAYEAGVKSMVYRLDLEEKGLEEEFLQFCTENSSLDTGIFPEPGAQILTLSTCTGYGHSTRWVVQGYLAHKYLTDAYSKYSKRNDK